MTAALDCILEFAAGTVPFWSLYGPLLPIAFAAGMLAGVAAAIVERGL